MTILSFFKKGQLPESHSTLKLLREPASLTLIGV